MFVEVVVKHLTLDPPELSPQYIKEIMTNVRFISYSMHSNWHLISTLLSNFVCLVTFCYLDRANSIKTDIFNLQCLMIAIVFELTYT